MSHMPTTASEQEERIKRMENQIRRLNQTLASLVNSYNYHVHDLPASDQTTDGLTDCYTVTDLT